LGLQNFGLIMRALTMFCVLALAHRLERASEPNGSRAKMIFVEKRLLLFAFAE
jgi:hypothetical protein